MVSSACTLLALSSPPKPHIIMHLVDDWGWANAGWHANSDNKNEVRTPRMDALVKNGIELDRAYSFQFCSPTRSSLQSGRYPGHVNDKNADVTVHNPRDPVSGFAGIPRNMTGMAEWLSGAGYKTHQIGGRLFSPSSLRSWLHRPLSCVCYPVLMGPTVAGACLYLRMHCREMGCGDGDRRSHTQREGV